MKVKLHEHDGTFMLELTPDTAEEVNQLARFASGSRKKTLTAECTFYKDGNTVGYVVSKKHLHKNFGTIK